MRGIAFVCVGTLLWQAGSEPLSLLECASSTAFNGDGGHFVANLLYESGNIDDGLGLPFGVTTLDIVIEEVAETHSYPWVAPQMKGNDSSDRELVVTITAVLGKWDVTPAIEHELCAFVAGALPRSTHGNNVDLKEQCCYESEALHSTGARKDGGRCYMVHVSDATLSHYILPSGMVTHEADASGCVLSKTFRIREPEFPSMLRETGETRGSSGNFSDHVRALFVATLRDISAPGDFRQNTWKGLRSQISFHRVRERMSVHYEEQIAVDKREQTSSEEMRGGSVVVTAKCDIESADALRSLNHVDPRFPQAQEPVPMVCAVKQKRLLSGTGFHRQLSTELTLTPACCDRCDVAAPCFVNLVEHFPESIYVDPYQLRDLADYGGPTVQMASLFDLESPAQTSAQHIAIVRALVAPGGVAVHVFIPLHLRYHPPQHSVASNTTDWSPYSTASSFEAVLLPPRTVYVTCGTEEIGQRAPIIEVSSLPILVTVPVGDVRHETLVAFGTFSLTLLGAIWIADHILRSEN
jgi:hypothetical protein